jgi:hypothetical protein
LHNEMTIFFLKEKKTDIKKYFSRFIMVFKSLSILIRGNLVF